jgi:hypothetical protein
METPVLRVLIISPPKFALQITRLPFHSEEKLVIAFRLRGTERR